MEYLLNPINKKECPDYLYFNINQENYSAQSLKAKEKLNEFVSEEVSEDFLLPILKDKISKIPNTEVCLICNIR